MLLGVGACHQRSSIESRLIGTWASPALTTIYERDPPSSPPPLADDFMEITFTADHKEVWQYRKTEGRAVARWHVEGNDLVFTTESESFWGPPGVTKRQRIVKLTSDELIFNDGTNEGRWTRVR